MVVTTNVGIVVYENVEVLDLGGPYEVFTTASRLHARTHPADPALFRVFTLGREAGPVTARAGLTVSADHSFDDHPAIDVLIVPGGLVASVMCDLDLAGWLRAVAATAQLTVSVCTGAFILAQAGLLDGRAATTHWEDIDVLAERYPAVRVVRGRRWVDEGAVVTAAGVSAGIDMSLHLVERLAGRELAVSTARQMDYDWLHQT